MDIISEGLNEIAKMKEKIIANNFNISSKLFFKYMNVLKEESKIDLVIIAERVLDIDTVRINQNGISYIKEKYGW